MHVNVSAIALVCLYVMYGGMQFLPSLPFHSSWHGSDELLCHLLFFCSTHFFPPLCFFSPLRPKTLIVFHFLLFAATASCSNKKQLKTKKSRSLSRICFGTRSPFYYYYAAQATVFLQTSPTVSSYPIRFFPFFVILQSENLHSVTKKKNRQRSKLQLFAVAVSTSRF